MGNEYLTTQKKKKGKICISTYILKLNKNLFNWVPISYLL